MDPVASPPPNASVPANMDVREETSSAVSWAAVAAGAIVTLAMSFVLLGLGAGFGMRLISPWPGAPPSLADFNPMTGAWLIVVQMLSSALGGYLAGRLRTKWLHVHSHEVHFRDTAHGLLAWALSTVIGVILAASVLRDANVDLSRATDEVAAQFSLFMTIALLLGAFIAAVAAAIGGLRRDEMHTKHRS